MNSHNDDIDLPDDVRIEPKFETALPVTTTVVMPQISPAPRSGAVGTWLDRHGPRPPGAGIRTLDVITAVLTITAVWLFAQAWHWVVFS